MTAKDYLTNTSKMFLPVLDYAYTLEYDERWLQQTKIPPKKNSYK